jgi:hypothetical protein
MSLEQYGLNDIEVASNTVTFEGYENAAGEWYIKRTDHVTNKLTEVRYARGGSGYSGAWASRAAQTYLRFGDTF